MQPKWQHVHVRTEGRMLTEGLYDHESGRRILRAASIGELLRIRGEDAERIRLLFTTVEEQL